MSRLIEVRGPTAEEAEGGAYIVFVRLDKRGERRTIKAAPCYESWQQWGETTDILGDNVSAVEAWRRGLDDVLSLVEDLDAEDEDLDEDEEEYAE